MSGFGDRGGALCVRHRWLMVCGLGAEYRSWLLVLVLLCVAVQCGMQVH